MNKKVLLSSLFAAFAGIASVSADVIEVTTSKAVGEELTLSFNEGVNVVLQWQGSDAKTTVSGENVKVPVQGETLSLTTDLALTHFDCSDNDITSINFKSTPNLSTLYCKNNKLTALNTSALAVLQVLDCSNNELSELTLSKNTKLYYVNFAHNALSKFYFTNLNELETCICNDNNLTVLAVSVPKKLQTLWCYNNALTKITLGSGVNPVQLCAFNNQLTTLDLSNCTALEELWLDNNKLTTLDVSKSSIKNFSVSNNELTKITHNKNDKSTMEAFYVENNELSPSSFVTVYNNTKKDTVRHFVIEPQRPFYITDKVNINEVLSLNDLTRYNAWGVLASFSVNWVNDATGEVLVKNTDYKAKNADFTFYKGFASVHLEATSVNYPGVNLKSQSFRVIDPAGVDGVTQDKDVEVYANDGQIVVKNTAPMPLQIFDVSGRRLVNTHVPAGQHSWNMPAGVYIVAGVKVIVH